jgi:hypothetical protein
LRVRARKHARELYLRPDSGWIEPDRVAQQRFGLFPIAHAGSGGAQRCPNLAFESRFAIARLHQLEEIGKFILTQQGVCQNRQVVRLIAVALAGGARLPLGQPDVAELEVDLRQSSMQDRILRRLANGIAQLDFGGLQVPLCRILFGVLDRGR